MIFIERFCRYDYKTIWQYCRILNLKNKIVAECEGTEADLSCVAVLHAGGRTVSRTTSAEAEAVG